MINIRKLQRDPAGVPFDCGIAGINDLVQRSYYPTILQHLYAFEILVDGVIVGYYMYGFRRIKLSESPGDIGDYISDLSEYCYALHIRYIAISEQYQRIGIGSKALGLLILQVQELCKTWPVRLITLDALKEKVEWYKSKGFVMFNEDDIGNSKKDVAMYLDCLVDPEKLERYTSEHEEI